MSIKITYSGGWSGGRFLYNGKTQTEFVTEFKKDPRPFSGLPIWVFLDGIVDGGEVVKETLCRGSDSDHGIEYSWTFTDYAVKLSGDRIPRTESLLRLLELGVEVTYEVKA